MAPLSSGHARAGSKLLRSMVAAGCLLSTAAVAADSLELAVKATYLYKFAPFVQWPTSAFGASDSPLRICTAGDSGLGGLLDRAVQGQQLQHRPILVVRLKALDPASVARCHILFVPGSARQVADAVRPIARVPVLTVANGADATAAIIQFVKQGNRVRFAVNLSAASAAGLQLSSKLLQLATRVER